jgi:hypothetical protein
MNAVFAACQEKIAICGRECVVTQRILNLYGMYATASVIFTLPRIKDS